MTMANLTKSLKRIAQIISSSYICAVSRGFLPSFSRLMPDEQSKSRFTTSNVKRFFYVLSATDQPGPSKQATGQRPVQRAVKNSASPQGEASPEAPALSPIYVNRFGRLDCFESAS